MSRFTTEQYPDGGWLVKDGGRMVAFFPSREEALWYARQVERRPSRPMFQRAEEDRLDSIENHVSYPKAR